MKTLLGFLALTSFATFLWLSWEARRTPLAKDVLPHSRKCAWCGKHMSDLDRELEREGALVSHGMCDGCAETLEGA